MTRRAKSRLVNNAQPGKAVVQELSLSVDFSSNREDTFEIHAHMDRTSAGFAYGVRECAETNPRGFQQWKAPGNFKIELFVIRVGDWGGYMLLDCDDATAVHKFCSMLPAFVFEARPVIPIEDAVRVELEAIAFRDGLKRK